jgi:hypothetical protein
VFGNSRGLGTIFGPKRDEVTGDWRRLQDNELYDFYSSQNVIRVVKSRKMRWAGHVACMGGRRCAYRVWLGGDLRERLHMEDCILFIPRTVDNQSATLNQQDAQ